MKSILTVICLAMFLVLQFPGQTHAGNLTTLVSTEVLKLKDNQKWEKKYETPEGKFKIRFRKLWNSSSEKRYHIIIWWNDKRIADGYCPENYGGYAFDIYQDSVTKRLFVALKTNHRDVLMGYEPMNGRLEKYADSRNYYSPLNNPRMRIDKDGDVLLSFIGNGREIPMEYKLFWVEDARWFGYKDVTYRPQPAAPTAPQAPVYYEPEYTYESYYEPSTPEEASYSYEEEELYYEETSVVGS